MKKILFSAAIVLTVIFLANCHSAKKTTVMQAPKMTYETNLQPMIAGNCSPCHIPAKGGRVKAYDNYANVKTDIDEIIRRINLNPTDKGFMPFKHPKLSDSTIAVFVAWRNDGMMEH
jgi:mono/diheme cytochrome c family protein